MGAEPQATLKMSQLTALKSPPVCSNYPSLMQCWYTCEWWILYCKYYLKDVLFSTYSRDNNLCGFMARYCRPIGTRGSKCGRFGSGREAFGGPFQQTRFHHCGSSNVRFKSFIFLWFPVHTSTILLRHMWRWLKPKASTQITRLTYLRPELDWWPS